MSLTKCTVIYLSPSPYLLPSLSFSLSLLLPPSLLLPLSFSLPHSFPLSPSPSFPLSPSPSLPDSAVFGATLDVAVQRSTLGTDQLELPTVFRQCIDFLEEHGTQNIILTVYVSIYIYIHIHNNCCDVFLNIANDYHHFL